MEPAAKKAKFEEPPAVEEPVEKKQKAEEPDGGLEDDSWADGPTSSTPAVGEAVAAAASSGATDSVVAADAEELAEDPVWKRHGWWVCQGCLVQQEIKDFSVGLKRRGLEHPRQNKKTRCNSCLGTPAASGMMTAAMGTTAAAMGTTAATAAPAPEATTVAPAPGATTAAPAPGGTTAAPADAATTAVPPPGATTAAPAPEATTAAPADAATTAAPAPGDTTPVGDTSGFSIGQALMMIMVFFAGWHALSECRLAWGNV